MQQYKEFVEEIINKGVTKPPAREKMPSTLSLFGHQFRHDLNEGFPLLTTKYVPFKSILVELLWFLRGDSSKKFLEDNKCKIWDEDQQRFENKNKWTEEGDFGYQYPSLWRKWGEVERRWQPSPTLATPVFSTEFPITVKSTNPHVGQYVLTKQGYEYYIYDYNPELSLFYIYYTHSGFKTTIDNQVPFVETRYPYHKTHLDVACVGNVNMQDSITTRLYKTWGEIIDRCYNKTNVAYAIYGGKGVYVSNRWLCFEYFLADVQEMKNWQLKLDNWEEFTLDKEFGKGYIYSKEECIWSVYNYSTLYKMNYIELTNSATNKTITLKSIKEVSELIGQKEFIVRYGKELLDGTLGSLGGWRFSKVKDELPPTVDQFKVLVEGLKNSPMSRRHIITAWNPDSLEDMALNACHALVQFNCRPLSFRQRYNLMEKTQIRDYDVLNIETEEAAHAFLDLHKIPKYTLDCQMYQRSADVFLGVPFNIGSYALLTYIVAELCNMQVGEFIHTFGDAHIYSNHKQQLDVQLMRTARILPKVTVDKELKYKVGENYDFTKLDDCFEELFTISNYDPHARIKGKLSTGLN